MEAIKRNVVGLLKFTGLLFTAFVLPVSKAHVGKSARAAADKIRTDAEKKYDKIDKALGFKTAEYVTPNEVVFCPVCHQLAATIRRSETSIQIIRNGIVLLTISGNSIVNREGKSMGFPVRCPNGHTVEVK